MKYAYGDPPAWTRVENRPIVEGVEKSPLTKEEALQLVSKIRENMTFDEVAEVIPTIRYIRPFDGQHVGVWFAVPIGGGYRVSVRFEHPSDPKNPDSTKNIHQCLVNLPPAVDGPGIEP